MCLTLCNPIDCTPPGSSVHGILQARLLEWVAMPSSRGSFRPRDRTCVSCSLCTRQAGTLPLVPPGKPNACYNLSIICISSHTQERVKESKSQVRDNVRLNSTLKYLCSFAGGAGVKEPVCQCRRHETQVRSLGQEAPEGHGNPLQYSCLENPKDRGA